MARVSDDRLAAAREVVSMIRTSADFREGVATNPAGGTHDRGRLG